MRFLDVDQVLYLHQCAIETGPTDAPKHFGVRHEGAILAALERCRWGPFEKGDLWERTAFLLRGICQDHPFEDGNKRAAVLAADAFLRLNGRYIDATYAEGERFIFAVARGEIDVTEIAAWLERHAGNV